MKRTTAGFTMIEMMIVVAVIALLAAVAAPQLNSWFTKQRARTAARSVSDLVGLARQQAIRTRVNHLFFVGQDAQANPLPADGSGVPYAAAVVTDTDGDGLIDPGETIVGVSATPGVFWGVAGALAAAPNDGGIVGNFAGGFTFRDSVGAAAQWLVFRPDGIPLPFNVTPYNEGAFGQGGGGVYLNDASRDYAIVVTALGGTRLRAWEAGAGVWR